MTEQCEWCLGAGIVECGECDGFGYIVHYENEDDEIEEVIDCYGCDGRGEVACHACGGLG